jgi:hypothetical protein
MNRKKWLWGALTLALVFALALAACDTGGGGDGDSHSGTITVLNLPNPTTSYSYLWRLTVYRSDTAVEGESEGIDMVNSGIPNSGGFTGTSSPFRFPGIYGWNGTGTCQVWFRLGATYSGGGVPIVDCWYTVSFTNGNATVDYNNPTWYSSYTNEAFRPRP